MKIAHPIPVHKTRLGSVNPGTVVEHSNRYYLRVWTDNCEKICYLAIALDNGTGYLIDADTLVTVADNAVITFEDKS